MNITIPATEYSSEIVLTTEHASSSYGQPVAVIAGQAYGPEDELRFEPPLEWLAIPIRQQVFQQARATGMLEHPLVRQFTDTAEVH